MCAVPDGSRLLMQTRGEERAAVSTILPDHLQVRDGAVGRTSGALL